MSEPINVLIAEDNAADRMLIKEILLDTEIPPISMRWQMVPRHWLS